MFTRAAKSSSSGQSITVGGSGGIDRRQLNVGTHMCTHSGKTCRCTMAEGEVRDSPVSVDLTSILTVWVEDGQRMECKHVEARAEDRCRHEEQMELMRQLVEELKRTMTEPSVSVANTPKLVKLTEQDDIEVYLTVFNRTMGTYRVGRSYWLFMLAPQLTGRAQRAFAAMEAERSGDYDALKDTILARYNINNEAYRQRFRAFTKKEETYCELATHVMDLAQKWTKGCTTKEEVLEAVDTEQLLNTMPEDVQVWVHECKPEAATEAGQLAEDFVQARKRTTSASNCGVNQRQEAGEQRRCHTCNAVGHLARDCPKGDKNGGKAAATNPSQRPRREVECCNCHQKGHVMTKCPAVALYCGAKKRAHSQGLGPKSEVYWSGQVEGQLVKKVLFDTRCSRTMVIETGPGAST